MQANVSVVHDPSQTFDHNRVEAVEIVLNNAAIKLGLDYSETINKFSTIVDAVTDVEKVPCFVSFWFLSEGNLNYRSVVSLLA